MSSPKYKTICTNKMDFFALSMYIISWEQRGFVSGRSSLDNIIALQEIAHSITRDFRSPPRLLLKLT